MGAILTSYIQDTKKSVANELATLLNPLTIPFLSLVGFGEPCTNVEHSWNEYEMFDYKSTLDGDIAVADTVLDVASGTGKNFRVGHIIQIDDELMKVTAVSGDTLTITKGYGGTVDALHLDAANVEVCFMESTEGQVAVPARYSGAKWVTNYTQIFTDTIEVTGTAAAVAQYGINNLYEIEKQKKQAEIAYQINRAIIKGIKYKSGINSYFSGISTMITTNIVAGSNADVTLDKINELVQKVSSKVGNLSGRYIFLMSHVQKRKLGTLDTNKVIIDRSDIGRGETVNELKTDLGVFPIVIDNCVDSDTIFFIDLNRCTVRPLMGRELFHMYLGDTGDVYKGMLVGEYTFEFRQEAAHAKITGLKTA